MAKCFEAKKSKAGNEIKCGRCQAVVQRGEKYFYFAVGFRGAKQIRCHLHHPKQSELCGSKMSGAYAANEALEDRLDDSTLSIEDIAVALEETASDIESVRDEYQESYDALPENFQQGDQGSDIQERIDGLSEYAENLNNTAQDVRDIEEPSAPDEPEDSEADSPADDGDLIEQAREMVENVISEFSL